MLKNDVKFNAALGYIDRGNYEKAITLLNERIDEAVAANNEGEATEIRCVLGELYANLGNSAAANECFTQVKKYCSETNLLPAQAKIAEAFMKAIAEGRPVAPAASAPKKSRSVPLVPKPVQNKGFITKAMSKRRK